MHYWYADGEEKERKLDIAYMNQHFPQTEFKVLPKWIQALHHTRGDPTTQRPGGAAPHPYQHAENPEHQTNGHRLY